MDDSVPRKSRIPHWGWWLAGTMLPVVVFWGIRYGIPLYQRHQTIAQQREMIAEFRGLGFQFTANEEPNWLPEWFGTEWKVVLSPSVDVVSDAHSIVHPVARKHGATDSDLLPLTRLPHIKNLWLSNTQVTDAGLVHLAELTSLEELYLGNTQITDVGLSHLSELKKLKLLELSVTQVSPAGIAKLKAALPACKIKWP